MWLWIGFIVFIVLMLALDLGLLNRKPHVIGMKEALAWFFVWISLALGFNIGLMAFHERGIDAGLEFFAGYLVEKALSIDNVFVFILIFNYFNVPPIFQHKVLAWGIVGAIVLRMVFIVGGLALLARFHWVTYLFGLFLLATGLIMMFSREIKYEPEKNWVIRAVRRMFPMADRFESNRFFVWKNGLLHATPLLITLIAIETSDIVFAADSIPAIFAITSDPFIVFTSNIFAMLGLRALYFAVQGFMTMFHFLHHGFASIIVILGSKMLLSDVYKVPIAASLVLIIFILLICVIASLLRPRKADLKLMFERTEKLGLIPFRRLLMIENIIDIDDMKVADSMRDHGDVHVIHLDNSWEENLKLIRKTKFSRYPIVEREDKKPIGVIHVKSILVSDSTTNMTSEQLRQLARPCFEMREDLPLTDALERFQQRHDRLAIVIDENGNWTGILTFEDVLQEIVGNMGDEFELARAGQFISLVDALSPGRIVLDLQADNLEEAIQNLISQIPRDELPIAPEVITRAVLQHKQVIPIYIGEGLAIPHGRFAGIGRPLLAFARSNLGVPIENTSERVELIFLLLTPIRMARVQQRLLANIVALFKSEYVSDRLRKAQSPDAVIEAIRAGQQVAIG